MLILDSYSPRLGDKLMAAGELPSLRRLRSRSARFALEHGAALGTGLHGEHMSTGLDPATARRHSAVYFDADRYTAWQQGTSLAPYPVDPGIDAIWVCARSRGDGFHALAFAVAE